MIKMTREFLKEINKIDIPETLLLRFLAIGGDERILHTVKIIFEKKPKHLQDERANLNDDDKRKILKIIKNG